MTVVPPGAFSWVRPTPKPAGWITKPAKARHDFQTHSRIPIRSHGWPVRKFCPGGGTRLRQCMRGLNRRPREEKSSRARTGWIPISSRPRSTRGLFSWNDARAYIDWLSRRTGERYRFLSESEWEYVARAGTTTRYFFGDSEDGICRYANVPDVSAEPDSRGSNWQYVSCDDGYGVQTAPVGSYAPNAFGLYDVHGNVWEWTQDCYRDSFVGAPTDGSPWLSSECEVRVVRGGSLSAPPISAGRPFAFSAHWSSWTRAPKRRSANSATSTLGCGSPGT